MTAFSRLDPGKTDRIVWEIRKGRADSWSDFVADVWTASYDRLLPRKVDARHTAEEAKAILANFFDKSYVTAIR